MNLIRQLNIKLVQLRTFMYLWWSFPYSALHVSRMMGRTDDSPTKYPWANVLTLSPFGKKATGYTVV